MDKISDPLAILRPIAQKAAENQPHDDSDYEKDGLLYCGKCHTPKQCLLTIPRENGEEHTMKVPVLCECRRMKIEQEEKRRREEKDMSIIRELRNKSLMDSRFKDQTFQSFRTTKDNERAFQLCKRYTERFENMIEKNQGLLFWGDVGTGKTFAAACIANELLTRKTSVVMTSFVKLLETMQRFTEDDVTLVHRLNKVKLLIIDDLGAERGTEFALEKVYDIIDSRYRAKLPMILTTNLSLDDMKRTTDIRYARIYDRIFEVCYPVQFKGPSFRKAEANRRFREMKELLEG